MNTLRTPDSRFADLPDYPFAPNYAEVDGLRMHYIDEGPRDADTLLLLHGEPSWSYLYRHMIPPFVEAGFRCVAPDLVGFGRSDKPSAVSDYSYASHVDWMRSFIETVDLTDLTLVCQDWGSLIGLRVAAENSGRFARIALANGGLPTGDAALPKMFYHWQRFAKYSPWFPIGKIIANGSRSKLSKAEVAAYDAPFPSGRYKKGTRAFPLLVPTTPDDPAAAANQAAWEVFDNWEKPFLTAFSDRDPITRGGEAPWRERVPGAKGQPHTTIKGGGHFLQEDKGPELARAVIDFCHANPLS